MLPSIYLDDNILTANIKIHNKIPDILLPVYRKRELFQKLIPQLLFFIGHILTKILCVSDKLLIILQRHYSSIPRTVMISSVARAFSQRAAKSSFCSSAMTFSSSGLVLGWRGVKTVQQSS